jgi:hypothetical protein
MEFMFENCSGLTSVTLNNGITTLGGGMFYDCNGLRDVEIPDSVKEIPSGMFTNCRNLRSVTIGSGVTNFKGESVFYNCYALSTIKLKSWSAPTYYYGILGTGGLSSDGKLYYPKGANYSNWLASLNSYNTSSGRRSWKGIEFNDRPEISVDEYDVVILFAASGKAKICSNISGVTEINVDGTILETPTKYYTFESERKHHIIKYKFANGEIPDGFLYNMASVFEVKFNSTVISIGKYAFNYCDNLDVLHLSESIKTIGDFAFNYCTKLDSIEIPDSVTSIGKFAFNMCGKITGELHLPDTLNTIGEEAFASCSGVSTLSFGTGLTTINDNAFKCCANLSSITSTTATAPLITNNTFMGVKDNGTLYYPSGSDYSSWLSTGRYYLGYHKWVGQKIS